MKNTITLIIIALCLVACKGQNNANLTDENMPNDKTRYETIEANGSGNPEVIGHLKSLLTKAGFTFQQNDKFGRNSGFNDCKENKIITIRGTGLKAYLAKSHKPEKGPMKNLYADFFIEVYGFSTNEIAQQHYDTLSKALYSADKTCNGKAPEKIVLNGNTVFYLGTRAEAFRGYIEKYGKAIEDYR